VNRDLLVKLALPLGVVAAGALVVHHWWDYGGALVNVATGLIIVILTVSYVEWVLRRHESEAWGGTDARVRERLDVFVNATISSVRIGLGFSPDVTEVYGSPTLDSDELHRRVLLVSKDILEPDIHVRMAGLDEAGWGLLMTNLQSVWAESERLLDRFYHRLRPRQVELMLDIQSAIERSMTFWRTFPDVMGVPPERLPHMNSSAADFQAACCKLTADEIVRLLVLARELDGA
jgi:hypothetical protein